MRLAGIAVMAAWLGAISVATPSQALPVTYGFSVRVTSFLTYDSAVLQQRAADDRAYLLAHPGEATPGWSGTFSYDSDTGEFSLSLVAPYGDPLHPVELGGATAAGFAGDLDVVSVSFASGQPYPRYFSRQNDYQDVISWYGTSSLELGGSGLVVAGELSHGLTVADLDVGYLWGDGSPFDAPYLMYSYGCPQTETLVQCAYDGYYHYQDSTQTVLLSIADLHEIPEASVSLYFALALFLLATARRSAVYARYAAIVPFKSTS